MRAAIATPEPDFEVSAPDQVRAAVERHGLAIWRKLLPRRTTERLIDCAVPHLANKDAYVSRKGGVMSAAVCPPDLRYARVSAEIDATFRAFWGGPVEYCPLYCCYLIQTNGDTYERHPWHQDMPFLPGGNVLMTWTALVPCGVDAPSVSFATERPDRVIFRHPEGVARCDAADNAAVMAASGLPTVDLVLDVGDTVFFDGLSVHKTYFDPLMTQDRIAFKLAAGPKAGPLLPKARVGGNESNMESHQ